MTTIYRFYSDYYMLYVNEVWDVMNFFYEEMMKLLRVL